MQRYGPCRATAAERPHHVPLMRPGRRSTPQHDSPGAQGRPMTPGMSTELLAARHAISDLLRTATEFDEIADDLLEHLAAHFSDCGDYRTTEVFWRFDALRAAVRK